MAVQRRVSFLSQQRVDTPDVRALESAASNDFDQLIQGFATGTSQGYILRGFEIAMSGAIGGAASGLQLVVDPGAVFHILASQSGTFYLVPSGTPSQPLNSATNTIVDGAFAPSAINYVGIDYERYLDPTTSAQVYLWDPTSVTETTTTAPRAQILRYRIKISTSIFPSNVLPIAVVVTDAGNNVVSITDARWMMFRLGQGGANPNPFYQYPWTAQPEGRAENPSTSSSNFINPFEGGDKMLGSLKDWMNAIMTEIQRIKGTTYWYSQSSSGSLESLREDLGNTVITGRGHIAHGVLPADGKTPTAAGQINWDQDINIRVIGSNLTYTLTANPTSTDITLTEEMAAYVTLIRGVVVSPNLVFTNASPTVQSVGGISWTSPLQAGDWLKVGSDTNAGYYQIQSIDSLTQVTLTLPFAETSTGVIGTKAEYAYGSYQASPTPSTDRNIYIAARGSVPEGENIFWLFLRSDNGGSTPRVYIRFLGSELEEGVDRDISDDVPQEILYYIGSPIQSAFAPSYTSALTPGALPQITSLSFSAASAMTANQYFLINSSGNAREYYVWFKIDGVGTDPAPGGTNASVEVDILSTDTAPQVAAKVVTAMNATNNDDFAAVQQPSPNTNVVQVTNVSAGVAATTVNFNVGALTVSTVQSGTGTGNTFINDGDNLTLAIKKLDDAFASFAAALDTPSYDEVYAVSAAIVPTTLITIPLNSRLGNVQQKYTVGKGTLQVYLNGTYLHLGDDYSEYGTIDSISDEIETLINLVAGDVLHFRLAGLGGGAGGGGGEQGPPGPPGQPGPSGADAIGGPIAISTKNANYSVQLTDNALLADCTLGNVIFTLPSAASGAGHAFYFKKKDTSSNAMILQPYGSELIDGQTTQQTGVQYEAFTIFSDGTEWYIF